MHESAKAWNPGNSTPSEGGCPGGAVRGRTRRGGAWIRNSGALLTLLAALGQGSCDGREAAPGPPAREAGAPVQQDLHEDLLPLFDALHEPEGPAGARTALEGLLAEPGEAPRYQVEFLLGYSFHREKRYARARELFEVAVGRQPDYHAPHHFLGFACYYLGDLDRAEEAFRRHRELRPGEGDDAFGLALCALDRGLLDEAEDHLEEALALHEEAARRGRDRRREVAKVLARQGDVHDQRGDVAAARDRYERAVMLWPAQDEIWHKLERVLRRQGEEQLADIAADRAAAWRAQERGAAGG